MGWHGRAVEHGLAVRVFWVGTVGIFVEVVLKLFCGAMCLECVWTVEAWPRG